jgi:hypothetical protein
MIVKVSQVAAEFRRVSNKQMTDTTKRTIKENVSINNQLNKMSEKTIEIIENNDNLVTKVIEEIFKFINFKTMFLKILDYQKDKVHKIHIDMLEDNEKELAKKNASYLKVINMLTDKCRNQEIIINEYDDKLKEVKLAEDGVRIQYANLSNQM